MADFRIIETQEQLDAILGERLSREREKLNKEHSEASAELQSKYEALQQSNADLTNQINAFNEKYAGYDDKLAELEKKNREYETNSVKMRIAHEKGLPYGMVDRIKGETEEEIKADADALLSLFPKPQPPAKSSEVVPSGKSEVDASLNNWLKEMKG